VVLVERLSWQQEGYLSGGHSGDVGVVAFSPNGASGAAEGAARCMAAHSASVAACVLLTLRGVGQ
jgi:hypothetical protein